MRGRGKASVNRKTERLIGLLFIIATAGSVVGGSLIDSVIDSPEKLVNVVASEPKMMVAVLLTLVLAISVILIPALLFPVLKRQDEKLALSYFAVRILEALTPIVDIFGILMLISLSRSFIQTGASSAAGFQMIAGSLLAMRDWAFILNPIIFGFGSLLLNYSLYVSRVIPRWLSGWGLIGALMVTTAGILGLFENFTIALAMPIAIQEMVFALWLIFKGFKLQTKS